jgi:hypothetical protein
MEFPSFMRIGTDDLAVPIFLHIEQDPVLISPAALFIGFVLLLGISGKDKDE